MLILDTHALIYDALSPERLTTAAAAAIADGDVTGSLAISDISLWEITMLIEKGRLSPGDEPLHVLRTVLLARSIRVLPITPEIAVLSQSAEWTDGDPADRIIAATTIRHRARLVTSDGLQESCDTENNLVAWPPPAGETPALFLSALMQDAEDLRAEFFDGAHSDAWNRQ